MNIYVCHWCHNYGDTFVFGWSENSCKKQIVESALEAARVDQSFDTLVEDCLCYSVKYSLENIDEFVADVPEFFSCYELYMMDTGQEFFNFHIQNLLKIPYYPQYDK